MSPVDLPHVDEHATLVRAPREQAWASLLETLTATFSRPPAAAYARLVGCADVRASGSLVVGAAETRAAFPGAGGRLYRAALMRTGGHVLGVRRLLAGVRRRAEA